MDAYIEITESSSSFKSKVFEAIADQLTFKFLLASRYIENDVKAVIPGLLKNTNEYKKLTTDPKTIADFGFIVGTQINKVDAIINKVVENIKVTQNLPFKARANSISGGISIGMIIKDFSDVLNMPEAIATTTKKGFEIRWLEWLLTKGTVSIINKYHVEYGNFGRSKEGRMKLTGSWHVEQSIAGDMGSNWLTRGLIKDAQNLRDELDNAIVTSIQSHL